MKLTGWTIYYKVIRWYTVVMGNALFNYAMIKRAELYRAELEELVAEAKERGGLIKTEAEKKAEEAAAAFEDTTQQAGSDILD